MATLCTVNGTCNTSDSISIEAIIGIVLGSFTALTSIITIIVIISILYKQKNRQPVVWVQPPAYHTAIGYTPSMNMSYYSPHGQSVDLNTPCTAYEQEHISRFSNGKVEV